VTQFLSKFDGKCTGGLNSSFLFVMQNACDGYNNRISSWQKAWENLGDLVSCSFTFHLVIIWTYPFL